MKVKPILARALLTVTGLAFGLVVAEVSATLFRTVKHGSAHRDVLIKRRNRNDRTAKVVTKTTQNSFESRLVLHPLFGYTSNPKLRGVNNFGFTTKYDFSIVDNQYCIRNAERKDLLVVGIFGGSFAHQTGELDELLEQKLVALFPGKTPVVLNLATGGHALPQTAFIYFYFQDLCDIVIFIDGLNELWNYVENNEAGFPPEYAKATLYQYKISREALTPEIFELTGQLTSLERRRKRVTDFSLQPIVRNSIVVHYFWNWRTMSLSHQIDLTSLAIKTHYLQAPRFFDQPDEEILEFSAQQWRRYHEFIHFTAARQGALSFHLLQPNPFIPKSKELTAKEIDRVNHSFPVRSHVEEGYPKLIRELPALKSQGILVDDMTGIYKNMDESIWVDAAHANERGYRMVIDRIVTNIANSPAQENLFPAASESNTSAPE